MRMFRWVAVAVLALGCSAERPEKAPAEKASVATGEAQPKEARAPRSPREILDDPDVKLALQQDYQALLKRLQYKPDPYADGPGCVSEARSTLREELLLTVRMQLSRDAQGAIQVAQAAYFVSETKAAMQPARPASPVTPRLELVHQDGRVDATDFVGLRDDAAGEPQLEQPLEPTGVKAWLASAPMDPRVVAHRIVLDGRVLREVKRPPAQPELSAIRCDDQKDLGVKLSWDARAADPKAPLLVDVLRHGPLGFVEELPFADARAVTGFTIAKAARAERDAVLLVAVTDTFSLVTRGVLVPRQ